MCGVVSFNFGSVGCFRATSRGLIVLKEGV